MAGPKARELFATFTFAEGDEKKYDSVVSHFEDHCKEEKNETVERYKLRCTTQQEGQSFDQFLTELRKKAKSCGFGDLKDSMIRDQIVVGIQDSKLREKLLKTEKLDLKKAISICKANELVKAQTKEMLHEEGAINAVGSVKRRNDGSKGTTPVADRPGKGSGPTNRMIRNCGYCGSTHMRLQCPAYGKSCDFCGKLNHFSLKCRSKKSSGNVRAIEDDDSSEEGMFVGHVKTPREGEDSWKESINVNGTPVIFLIDTGSRANILSLQDHDRLRQKPKVRQTSHHLKAYNNIPIPVIGICTVKVERKGREYDVDMMIVKDGISIMGAVDSERVGLVTRVFRVTDNVKEQVSAKYPELFKGIGCLPVKHKMRLEENVSPVIRPARRSPVHIRDELKKELDRLLENNIISRIEEPTDWVNQMVWERKPSGSLRICINPRDLNKAVKREHYQLPTREEIEAEMGGAKYFSKLDAANGFFQIELEEESAKLCTFATPFGRFFFNRLPMGLTSSPEVFHRTVSQILEGLEGVRNFIDDIVVWGSTLDEHNHRLELVL